jgi:two-component system NtrC family sensor kinase
VATVVVPLAVFAGAGYVSYQAEFDAAHERIDRTVDVAFEHAAKVFETHQLLLGEIDELLRGLSDRDVLAREADLHERLAAITRDLPQVQEISVFDRDGHTLLAARHFPAPHAINQSDRDYFVALKGGYPGIYIGTPDTSRADASARSFAVAHARRGPDGGVNGVVAIFVEPAYFEQYWMRTADGVGEDGLRVGIMRADGALLARQPEPLAGGDWRGSATLLAQLGASPERGFGRIASDSGGHARLIAWRRLSVPQVYVFAALPEAAIIAAWLHLMERYLLLGLPATLALAGIALVALRRAQAAETLAATAAEETRRRWIAEEAARQAQKLEALGQLTGGVAHDFNNLLSVIIGNAELIRGKPPERVERSVNHIMQAARRGAELTQSLLSFARRRLLNPQPIDLAANMPRLGELLKMSLRGNIEFRCQVADDLWPIEVDPGELEVALLNLTVNARDAMPGGGRLELTARNVTVFAGELAGTPELSGDFVAITLRDTGSGMPPHVAERAFEPFFTTKDVGRGTGLGLSQVYGFVRQSGGAIELETQPGAGTAVRIHLPRASRQVDRAPPRDVFGPIASGLGARSILLVEDNPEVADITAETLRSLGAAVEPVNRARAALDRLAADGVFFDFVVSDIVMPDGMSGLQLAREIRARYPQLPVLLMSGYSDTLAEAGAEFPVVAKPLSQAALADAIRRLSGDRPPPRIVVDNTRRRISGE